MKVMERKEETPGFFVDEAASSLLEGLRRFFAERGVVSYVVGGFVRDGLLGKASQDIDIVIDGPALDVARRVADHWGGSFVLLDEQNRIARVVMPGGASHLDFSSMRGNLENDLSLRDFTVNAIALDLSAVRTATKGPFVDPFDGRADLRARRIRAVRDSAFEEDPVRLLRAVRLARQLGFQIDAHTESLVLRHHALISAVAGERVRDELCLLLAESGAGDGLRWLDRLGLLCTVMPELSPAKGAEQPKEHYWDVFEHSIETVAAVECLLRSAPCHQDVLAAVPWSEDLASHFTKVVCDGRSRQTLVKLVALLHDVAKPQTKTFEPSGRMRFFGHGTEGAAIVEGIMERLRFSRREVSLASTMVEHHLRPGQLVGQDMPTQRAIYRYFRDTGEAGVDTVFLNLADHLAARGPLLDVEEFAAHARVAAYMLEKHSQQQTATAPLKLIDGNTIMTTFGLGPGPQIGRLLEAVREAQAVGEITSRGQALELVRLRLGQAESGHNQGKD